MEIRPTVETYAVDWSYGDRHEPITVTVVDGAGATVLLGGGDESIADELVAIARDHEVDVVLAEHGDIDHYAGIPALTEALDVEVAVPRGDADVLRDAGIYVDHPLDPGETYWGIETIAMPGHTPDNMAYRFEDVLIAGDTVCGSDSVFAAAEAWNGPLAIIEAQYNFDERGTRESIAALEPAGFETVLVAHGSHVLEGGPAAWETVVADAA